MVDLHSDGGLGHGSEPTRRPAKPQQPRLTDREVPLQQDLSETTRVLSPAIHAWLDGELPEASVRRGDTAADVEFWRNVNTEAERRRHMRMPMNLEAKIMESLPHSIPALITPWYRREFVITPSAAVTIGATLVTMSAAVTALLFRSIR
jgi:hypothetical protein